MTGGAGSKKIQKTSKTFLEEAQKAILDQKTSDLMEWVSDSRSDFGYQADSEGEEFDEKSSLERRNKRKKRIRKVLASKECPISEKHAVSDELEDELSEEADFKNESTSLLAEDYAPDGETEFEGPREHHAFLGRDIAVNYERQESDSNNCFCISAAALINQHICKKDKNASPVIDQYAVRAYVPEFMDREEFAASELFAQKASKKLAKSKTYDPSEGGDSYRADVKDVLEYTGFKKYTESEIDQIAKVKGKEEKDVVPGTEDKRTKGNIVGLGDLFLRLDSNACFNHMRFSIDPKFSEAKIRKMQDAFLNAVHEAISKGEAVSIYQPFHYRTIVGVNGSTILYLDSLMYDGKQILPMDISDLLNRHTEVTEISWISDKESPEKMTGKFGGLKHEKGKYERQVTDDIGDELALEYETVVPLKEGVRVTKTKAEKERDGIDPSVSGFIDRMLYIPKTDKTTQIDVGKLRLAADENPMVSAQKLDAQMQANASVKSSLDMIAAYSQRTNAAIAEIEQAKAKKQKPKEKKTEKKEVKKEAAGSSDESMLNIAESLDTSKHTIYSLDEDANGQMSVAVFNMPSYFQDSWLSFENTDRKGRSKEFCELQDVLNSSDRLFITIRSGRFELNEENYSQYLRLYQAVSAYTASHVNSWTTASKKRYEDAYKLRQALDIISEKILFPEEGTGYVQEIVQYSSKEKDYAAKNVGRLLKYYRKYCSRVDEDLIASDEEKIRRKWDALKTCERDILIYLDVKKQESETKNKPLSEEDAFLKQEYNSLKMQMMLRDHAKGKHLEGVFANEEAKRLRKHSQQEFGVEVKEEEDKDYSLNQDEGLTTSQISAISKIDTWIIRNFRNGGYMALAGVVSDRTDIVSKLMAMSRRKRLYIYHLIETRERLEPSADGFVRSQTLYEPDLKAFKDKMIASKLKFYKRFSGGYIYWNKLTEAMGIADRAQPMLSNAHRLLIQGNVQAPNVDETKLPPAQRQKVALEKLLATSLDTMKLIKQNQDKRTDAQTKAANEQKIASNRAAAYAIMQEVSAYTQEVQKKKAKSVSMEADKKAYTQDLANDTAQITTIAVNTALDENVGSIFKVNADAVKEISGYFTGSTSSLTALGALAGSLFTFLSLKNDHKSMTWFDFIATGSSLISGLAKTGKAITGAVVGFGYSSAEALAITSSTAAVVLAGVETGIAVVKTASYCRNGYYRCKASKLAARHTDQDKFRDGMLALNDRLAVRQRAGAATSVVNATLTTTAAVLIMSSVVTMGIGALAGLITLGISTALKCADSDYKRQMKMALFDNFFKTDEQTALAKANWERKHSGKTMTDEQVSRLKEQVRRRISADLGFYSPNHAAVAVAESYAQYLLDNAHSGGQKSDMAIAMIKGLGLHYTFDPLHPMDAVPQKSDIIKKLTT